jgi:hypothetical protein
VNGGKKIRAKNYGAQNNNRYTCLDDTNSHVANLKFGRYCLKMKLLIFKSG